MYAILRANKISTNADAASLLGHSFRNDKKGHRPHNADPSRAKYNSLVGPKCPEEAYAKYESMLPEKVRKNGVRMIEYLVAGSPEIINKMDSKEKVDYFNAALKWLREKHGAENVIGATVHRDETTPHMHVFVVPYSQERDQAGNLVKPGKLNAREFLGGKAKLTKMQTNFAKDVGLKHGLKRGEKGSRASHETVRDYYKRVNATPVQRPQKLPEIQAEDLKRKKEGVFKAETYEDVLERVVTPLRKQINNLTAKLNKSLAKNDQLAHNLQSAQTKLRQAERELEQLEQVRDFRKLSKSKKLSIAQAISGQLRIEAQEKQQARRKGRER